MDATKFLTPGVYQKLASRTIEKDSDFAINGRDLQIVLMALGVCGEVGEFIDVAFNGGTQEQIKKEMGDAVWYVAAIYSLTDIDLGYTDRVLEAKAYNGFQRLHNRSFFARHLAKWSGQVADIVKKGILHRHGLDEMALLVAVENVYCLLCAYADNTPWTMGEIMWSNIQKTTERYPDGFTVEDSKKRVDVK